MPGDSIQDLAAKYGATATPDPQALAAKYGATATPVKPQAILDPSGAAAQDPEGGISRFLHNTWDAINPMPGIREFLNRPDDMGDAQRALAAGMRIRAGKAQPGDRELLEKGMKTNLGNDATPPIVPGQGLGAAETAHKVGSQVASGNYLGAAGTVFGTAAPVVAGLAMQGKSIPVLPKITNKNPTEAAAMQFMEDKGIPVSLAAKTGNPFLKQVQRGIDTTPIGAMVASKADAAATQGLRSTATEFHARATGPVPAERYYNDFRAAEADPANLRSVQTGTRQVPVLNVQGNPIPGQFRTQAITEDMPLPVPVGILKPRLQPIFDEMQWMPAADRNASVGYRALEKILKGPDYIPASQAEIGLSGIKSLAREGEGRSAGLAKFIAPKLQALIDRAANIAGPQVMNSLQMGRKAAAAEMGAEWLQKTFQKAEAEGGFNKTGTIFNDWQRLKDSDKRAFFQGPALISDLDKFFLGAKRLADNPNPSGTALTSVALGSAGLVFTNPTTGIPLVIGTGALSKMMHTPGGVRLLTQGMRMPLDKPGAALIAASIGKMAGSDVKPAEQQIQSGPRQRPPLQSFELR